MEIVTGLMDFILNIDVHLGQIIAQYGALSYGIIFLIIFAETGFVFTPFLPGDSLLFAGGAFAALGSFNIYILLAILWIAAFLADTTNYWIGHFFGQKIIDNPRIPINQEHIDKTQAFYKKHGGKTIILARFIPIIRTFAPFVAGVGKMHYQDFVFYNALGGLIWVFGFTLLGFFFGNLPQVKENFTIAILAIIVLSVVPMVFEFMKHKLAKRSTNNSK
jgi:membrane-associated protein